MNKKKLMQMINASVEAVRNLTLAGNMDGATAEKEKLVILRAQYDSIEEAERMAVDIAPDAPEGAVDPIQAAQNLAQNTATPQIIVHPDSGEHHDSVHDFATAARRGFRVVNAASEGVSADGGYTVPDDIRTQVEQYRDASFSLRSLVSVENVTTDAGARTFQTKAEQVAFALVAEAGKIGAGTDLHFERLAYTIKKYGGYFPVTNELLADSDQNITALLTKWIGDGERATDNSLILGAIKGAGTATAITGMDDIKKVLNVTLGQAYKPTSSIVTNDDGLQILDTLKDTTGRYLLNPVPSDPAQLRLGAGATTIPVNVIPNSILATDTTNVPFIIGDLKEGIQIFDRQMLTILASNIAAVTGFNAFEQDMTLFRALLREDVVVRDKSAFKFCTLGE